MLFMIITTPMHTTKVHRAFVVIEMIELGSWVERLDSALKDEGVSNPINFECCSASNVQLILTNLVPKIADTCPLLYNSKPEFKNVPQGDPVFKIIPFV